MSDKTVWIINHYAESPSDSGSTRHFDLARQLRDLGWKTWIIAASVEKNTQKQRLAKGEQVGSEVYDDVHFRWINTPQYQGNGVRRIINMVAFSWRLLSKKATGDLEPPTVIIGSTVHLLAAAAAALLARRYRVPFVFEVRDIWPETLIAMGYTRRHSPLALSLGLLERWLCRRASRIISVLPEYDRYLKERAIKAPEVTYIPNGVNLNNIGAVMPYKKRAPFRITYLGAHGTANDLLTLIRAMELIEVTHQQRAIECQLIGAGPMKQALVDYCTAKGLKQVSFYPPVAKREIVALASDTQAFVLCGKNLPTLYKYGISMNKISDYLAMGRPVIIAIEAVNNPVLEAQAGLYAAPECPEELAEYIMKMAAMSETELCKMGLRGRQYVEQKHNVRTLAKRLADVMDQCLTV